MLFTTLSLIVGGCADTGGTNSNGGYISDPPAAILPEINLETGVATRGSQNFMPTFVDSSNTDAAYQRSMTECVERSGLDDPLSWRPMAPEYAYQSFVGVWRDYEAERFAFTKPIPLLDQLANDVRNETVPAEELAVAQRDAKDLANRLQDARRVEADRDFRQVWQQCESDPLAAHWKKRTDELIGYVGPWTEDFDEAVARAHEDDRMKDVKSDYVACLAMSGVVPVSPDSTEYDDFWTVVGEKFGTIDEQQIKLALEVVSCKERTNATGRVLDLVAEYEAAVYNEYEQELQNSRLQLEVLQSDLKEFWSDRGFHA